MATQGRKTHEQQLREFERKSDVPKPTEDLGTGDQGSRAPKHPDARDSEMAVSRQGMNQESRTHNKHNDGGQSGHKPQEPTRDQEKH